jgi:hypothetical protein
MSKTCFGKPARESVCETCGDRSACWRKYASRRSVFVLPQDRPAPGAAAVKHKVAEKEPVKRRVRLKVKGK